MKPCCGKICTKNADKLYVHTVVLCTLLVLIAIAVIVALGLYFGLTIEEYQSYNKVLNATALKTGNGTSLLLNGQFYFLYYCSGLPDKRTYFSKTNMLTGLVNTQGGKVHVF